MKCVVATLAAGLAAVVVTPGHARQPPASERADRRESAPGGWGVADLRTGEGRIVRIVRRGRGYAIEYHLRFPRELDAPLVGATLRLGGCRSGDRDGLANPDYLESAQALRDRFAVYLAECHVAPERIERILAGLEAVHPYFESWASEAAFLLDIEDMEH